jgi:hypothetical protein
MRVLGRIILYLVLAISITLLFVSFNLKPVLGDEGFLAMDGWRICNGEVPQRDFFQLIPPLAAYVQAFFFAILTPSVFSIRLLGLFYGLIMLISTYFLYAQFIKKQLFLALALSFPIPFGICYWYFGSHHWLCDILQIAGAIFLLSAVRQKSTRYSVFSGVFLGLAIFTLQDQGSYAIIGLTIGSVLVSKDQRKFLLLSAAIAAISFVICALPLAILAGPTQLYRDWIIFPLSGYKAEGFNNFSFNSISKMFMEHWEIIPFYKSRIYGISSAMGKSFIFFTPVLSIFSLIFIFFRKSIERTGLVIISIFSLSFLFCALHRLALTNLSWAFPSLFPFFIFLESGSESKLKPVRYLSLAAGFILLTVTLTYGITRINNDLHKEDYHKFETPAGRYNVFFKDEAISLQQLTDEIERAVPQKEPMFCLGYIPLVNFLTYHPNPTRFNFMFPGGYYSKNQLVLWIESLDRTNTIWGIGEREIMDEKAGMQLLPNYKVVFKNDRYILWKRKHA